MKRKHILVMILAAARVFRIRPDGAAYLAEAEKNVEALPSLAG